jgi:hypothetical protein
VITWNYRVFREPEGDYVIREVFYADDGAIMGCTENPVEPFGRTLDELAQSLDDFKAALALPVLTLDDIPPAIEAPKPAHSKTFSSAQVRAKLGLVDAPVNAE